MPSPALGATFRFDAGDIDAAAWAQDHAGSLITDITETTREKIRDLVADGLAEGASVDDLADEIFDLLGDEDRADLIARTESMSAANEGQRQAWAQAVDDGYLTGDEQRVWIATEGACPECEALDGETADLDGEYPDGSDGPPLHPNCRCTEGLQAAESRAAEAQVDRFFRIAFRDDQARDEHGRWTDTGGQATTAEDVQRLIDADVQGFSTDTLSLDRLVFASQVRQRTVQTLAEQTQRAELQMYMGQPVTPEQFVSKHLETWDVTSGDSNNEAIRAQRAVQAAFDLKDAEIDHLHPHGDVNTWLSSQPRAGDIALAKAEYANTQRWLEARHVDRLELYRGVTVDTRDPVWRRVPSGQTVSTTMQPASSWTTDRRVAESFAARAEQLGQRGLVLRTTVPRERVLSTPVTGRGALPASEIVILGGRLNVKVE